MSKNNIDMEKQIRLKPIRGVFIKKNKKWRASIGSNKANRNKYLGFFETKEEAAKVYDNEAKKIYGNKLSNIIR